MYEAKQYEDGNWAVVEMGDTLGNWKFSSEEEAQEKADELNLAEKRSLMTPEELHHLLREAQLEVAEIVVSRCESRIGALRPAIGMTISARAQRLLDSSDDRISSDDRDFLHEIAADFAL